jgi:hypothetical protein
MEFLNLDYAFDQSIDADTRLDYIFDIVDDWMLKGRFDKCDQILDSLYQRYLHMTETDPDIMIGFLTVTIVGKPKLQNRDKLAQAVHRTFVSLRGQTYADALMVGLL